MCHQNENFGVFPPHMSNQQNKNGKRHNSFLGVLPLQILDWKSVEIRHYGVKWPTFSIGLEKALYKLVSYLG